MEIERSVTPKDSPPQRAYDTWLRKQVQEALDDRRPNVPHAQVQGEMSGKKAELRNQLARRR